MTNPIADTLYPSTASPASRAPAPIERPGAAPAQIERVAEAPIGPVNPRPADLTEGDPTEYKQYDPRNPEAHEIEVDDFDGTEVPENIRALRDADSSRKLYDGSDAAAIVPPELVEMGADAAEWSRVMTDMGGTREDLATVSRLINAQLTAPVDMQTHKAWFDESQRYLSIENVSKEDLAAAKALYRRDERVYRQLEHLGLGNHPTVVKRFVELARSTRNRR